MSPPIAVDADVGTMLADPGIMRADQFAAPSRVQQHEETTRIREEHPHADRVPITSTITSPGTAGRSQSKLGQPCRGNIAAEGHARAYSSAGNAPVTVNL